MAIIHLHPEAARLNALREYRILDTEETGSFLAIAQDMAAEFSAPLAAITFVDRDRQWFKAEVGLGVRETPRDCSFCDHALRRDAPFVVPDTARDPCFAGSPLVTGRPHLRFYAGARLLDHRGFALGAVCVGDTVPRPGGLDPAQMERLQEFARRAMAHTQLHRLREEWQDGLPARMLARAAHAREAGAAAEAARLVDVAYAAAERRCRA